MEAANTNRVPVVFLFYTDKYSGWVHAPGWEGLARAALAEQTGFNEPIPHKPQYPFEIKSSADHAEKEEKR